MWTVTADQQRHLIGRWLLDGLNYRAWSVRDMTLVMHRQLITDLLESGDTKSLRAYLLATGEKNLVSVLDRETMGQTSGVEISDTPRLRGQS